MAKKSKYAAIKVRLQTMVEEANKIAQSLSRTSQAYANAKSTKPKSRKGDDLFTTNVRTKYQIAREISRIQVFMSDWRSTPEGAKYYEMESQAMQGAKDLDYRNYSPETAEMYRGAFGGQWLTVTGETYNTSIINEDLAKKAFQLYRQLVEEYQSEDMAKMLWSRETKASYDSENMIIALYDMITQGYDDKDIMDYARERMNASYLEIQERLFKAESTDDYGRINPDDYLNSSYEKAVKKNERRRRE